MVNAELVPRLSGKQRQALQRTLAYADKGFCPLTEAITMFFNYTDKGREAPYSRSQEYFDYCHLLLAHHLASGTQQEIWLDGHLAGDYPLGLVLQDYLIEHDFTRVPAFRDAWRLHRYLLGEESLK